jgi:hypothetical protein
MGTRLLLGIAFMTPMTLASAGLASAAEPNPVAELLRKVAAEEMDSGFCEKLSWPIGTRERYVRWLDAAVEGSAKVNRLKEGKQCQYDEVTRISSEKGRKCVHYTWHACLTGSSCGSGDDIECKQASGDWKRR